MKNLAKGMASIAMKYIIGGTCFSAVYITANALKGMLIPGNFRPIFIFQEIREAICRFPGNPGGHMQISLKSGKPLKC